MKSSFLSLNVLIVIAFLMLSGDLRAQLPTATSEHKILQQEVGTWDATVKNWMGPEGKMEQPEVSQGTEVNRMIGDLWLVTDFKGSFGGMEFVGHGTSGYDGDSKRYIGSWVDSFSLHAMHTTGSYDAEKKTMTWESTGIGIDGKPTKGKSVTVYQDEDHRTMTMYSQIEGVEGLTKVMEISYTRKK